MKLLLINPNTSANVTEVMRRSVQSLIGDDVRLFVQTASLGASYISSEVSYAIAAHGALDAWARFAEAHGEPDAILLGCFGDPGADALREASGKPVLGLAEAAMRQAAEGGRFSIVTGGAAWAPMLMRLARGLSLADQLVAVHTVAPSGADLLANRNAAIGLLGEACLDAASDGAAKSVILGGAALAGMSVEIEAATGLTIIDSVQAGVEMLMRTLREGATPTAPSGNGAAWSGLSPALLRRLA
jgi:allantoin racemase